MTSTRYQRPLPRPFAEVRARLIRKAWRGDPPRRTETWEQDGLAVVMDPAFPSPAPRFGWSPQTMLCEGLDVRPGERLLDLASAGGLVAMAAARNGAEVVAIDANEVARACLRRSFLMAGLRDPDVRASPDSSDERFDVITWTPPFLAGSASDPREERLVRRSDGEVAATLSDLAGRLRRGGRLLVPWPDRDATPWLHRAFADAGLRFSSVRLARYPVIGAVRLYRAWTPRRGESVGEVGNGEPLPGAATVLRDR